jgi:CspA family cold shock protein
MAAKERSSSAGSYIDTIPPIYDDSAWISMGSKLVNGHIGRGILLGTVAEVYGPSQSRKTTLCLSTASHAQRAALFKHKGQTVDLQLCEDAIFKGSAIAFQKLTQRPLGARNVYGLWTDRHDDVDLDGETKQELIEQMESASDIWTLRYEWLQARMPNAVLPIFRPPLKVIYLGSEVGGFLEEVAINLGVDLPALRVLYVDMVEEAFRELSDFSQECERDGCKGLAILDSLANLSTKTEKYRPDSVGMYGDQGKVIREEWRRNHKDIAERGVTVLAVSHMTGTGGKTGGTGTSFIASQIIQQTVEMADSNHPADDAWFLGEDGVSRVGIRVKIHCDKRRFSGLDGDAEVTVRFSAIEGEGFKSLTEGQEVEFDMAMGPKGPQATRVKKLKGNA